ncbi:unnamed protein product [Blepharisma stoltei]|uniref:FCP1 homology domain-containing protein n=1 Tax=Blepharisma stoltei TaxID=1481888 RepID=A0AAU9JJI4_9CILI|nr:unnamed protein product [Blepharisma stoltei]
MNNTVQEKADLELAKISDYSDEQPENALIQIIPEFQYKSRYYFFLKTIAALCSCLPPIFKKSPAKNKEENILLPPRSILSIGTKTLVLDLDETLIHSSLKPAIYYDFMINVDNQFKTHKVFINIRPGVNEFLEKVSSLFEVIVFTASISKYAEPLLNKIDPNGYIKGRLFRDSCSIINGNYVKDLSKLGRNLKDVIIIDNSPMSYSLQPYNGIPIISWFDDKEDRELEKLVPILEELTKVEDIRCTLKDLRANKLKISSENIANLNNQSFQQQIYIQKLSFDKKGLYNSSKRETLFEFDDNEQNLQINL